MVEADKVEVYLVRHSDGVRYQEHTAPFGTMNCTDNLNEKYVEVGINERFRIAVQLLEGFDFIGNPDVDVECRVDMGPGDRQVLPKIKPQYRPSFELNLHACFSEVDRVIDGQRQECGLKFVKLESDDDLMLTQDEIANAADQIGRITVTLQHALLASGVIPEDTSSAQSRTPNIIFQSSRILRPRLAPPHSINRPSSKTLSPGLPIHQPTHSPSSDGDFYVDEGKRLATTRSKSHDATRQNFNPSRRPTASPTPDQAAATSSRMSSRTLSAGSPSPPPRLSSKSNDNNDDNGEDIPFQDLYAGSVHNFFSCVEGDSHHNDDENGDHDHVSSACHGDSEGELVGPGHTTPRRSGHGHHNDDENGVHDHVGSASHRGSDGELVGLGYATLPRDGHKVTCQVCATVTTRLHKRNLSDVMRDEQQLEAEEAAATVARQERELKRREIEATKCRLMKKEKERKREGGERDGSRRRCRASIDKRLLMRLHVIHDDQ